MVAQPLTRDLLERTDCRDVARALWGDPVRESKNRTLYHHKGSESTASLWVYPDGFKNFGAGGEAGKTLDFIQYARDCDRESARQWLADWNNLPATVQLQRRPAPAKKKIAESRPDLDWQRSADTLVSTCEAALWSPAGRAALDYLHRRGLTDDTIQAWQLGYNIKQNCVTIPQYEGSALVRVHRRFLSPDAPTRYQCITGSKITLYGGDLIDPARPIVFVFGEFDALIGNQVAGDLAIFVTTGSDSNRLPEHWRKQLAALDTFILCHDNDESGQAVATDEGRARMGLPSPDVITSVPAGKDLTDFVTSGGDVRAWVLGLIERAKQVLISKDNQNLSPAPRPVWSASMLPGYVHYLLNSDVPDRALVLLALAAIEGGLNRPVDLSEIADRDLTFGDTTINIKAKTLRNILKRDDGKVFKTGKDLYTIEDSNPQVYKSFPVSKKRGPQGLMIALNPPAAFTLVLASEVRASVYRRYFPQGKKAKLFPALTVDHIADASNTIPASVIVQAHAEIVADPDVQRVYSEQDQPKARKRAEYAERSFKRLRQQLTARRLLTLPAWTIGTVGDLRSALYLTLTAKAAQKHGKSQLSAAYYAMMLGTTRTTAINIAARLAENVTQRKSELKSVKITSEAQLDGDLGGLPIGYEIYDPVNDKTVFRSAFFAGARSQAVAALRGRKEVTVKLQPANEQEITSWDQPVRPPRKRAESDTPCKPDDPMQTQDEITNPDPIEQKPRPADVWPELDDPRRAYAWQLIINLLSSAKNIRLVGSSLRDRRGNLLKHEPTGRDLLFYLGAECLKPEQESRAA